MANEYHVSTVGLEALEDSEPAAAVTTVGVEVQQTDDNATDTRITAVGLEVQQVDDTATDILVTTVGLEVLRSINNSTQQEGAISFRSELTLGIGGDIDAGARLAFHFELSLGLFAEGATFSCAAPAAKTWTTATPAATAWTCAVVTPAEECTGETETDNLEYVDGEDFAYLDGEPLIFTE